MNRPLSHQQPCMWIKQRISHLKSQSENNRFVRHSETSVDIPLQPQMFGRQVLEAWIYTESINQTTTFLAASQVNDTSGGRAWERDFGIMTSIANAKPSTLYIFATVRFGSWNRRVMSHLFLSTRLRIHKMNVFSAHSGQNNRFSLPSPPQHHECTICLFFLSPTPERRVLRTLKVLSILKSYLIFIFLSPQLQML